MTVQPDTIWETKVINGKPLRIGRPNYDKPGVRERVAREALDAEFATLPISNTNTLRYFAEVEKLVAYQRLAADAYAMAMWERENGALSRVAMLQERARHLHELAWMHLESDHGLR